MTATPASRALITGGAGQVGLALQAKVPILVGGGVGSAVVGGLGDVLGMAPALLLLTALPLVGLAALAPQLARTPRGSAARLADGPTAD